eukprot:7886501-Pyramimonas_sp.AAC.2
MSTPGHLNWGEPTIARPSPTVRITTATSRHRLFFRPPPGLQKPHFITLANLHRYYSSVSLTTTTIRLWEPPSKRSALPQGTNS